jgi:O-antigen/teichoic acid export membrane protein
VTAKRDVLDSPHAGALVARGGALRVAGFTLGIALSVVSVVIVTRHLGVVDYGRYQAVVSLAAVVGAIADAGLGTLALREYAQRDGEARDALLSTVLGLRLALAAAGVAVCAAAAAALGFDATMVAGAALAGAALVPVAAQTTLSVPLQGHLRLGTVTALEFLRQALTTAALVALALSGAGVLGFLAVALPVGCAVLLATLPLARGTGARARPAADRALWGPLLRVAIPVGCATAAGVVYLYTSLLVTELVATPQETGWYSAAFRVIVIVAAVPALLGTSAFPLLARAATQDRARFAGSVDALVEGTFLLGAAAALGAVLGAPWIIGVVAGGSFEPAEGVLRLQGAALGLTFVISALGFALLALHRHRALLLCNLAAFVVSAGAVALLASAHGQKGAALGAIVGEATLCGAYAVVLSRHVRLRPRRVVAAFAALVLGVAAGAALPVPSFVATCAGLLVFASAAWMLGGVPPVAREVVASTLRRLWRRGSA